MNRLILALAFCFTGCASTTVVSEQERFDRQPLVKQRFVDATGETRYESRPVSLEMTVPTVTQRALGVMNVRSSSLAMTWEVGCKRGDSERCFPDLLFLNLYSAATSVPRFLSRDGQHLVLEADGQILYDWRVFYAEPTVNNQVVREHLIAPFRILDTSSSNGQPSLVLRRRIDPLLPDSTFTLSAGGTLRGSIGEATFELRPDQLVPLVALMDTVAALRRRSE
jgi:hypothetical protein